VGGLGRRVPPDRVDFFVAALWVGFHFFISHMNIMPNDHFLPHIVNPNRLPMPRANDRSPKTMAGLLPTVVHAHPFAGIARHMLACHANNTERA